MAPRVSRLHLALCLLFIALIFSGCNTGYRKVDGKWSYVTWDEGHGYRTNPLGADDSAFTVLGNGEYAKDKNCVYYRGRPIAGAEAGSFVLLKGGSYPYAKDKNHVYLTDVTVVNADPNSFKTIKFPYARDNKGVYCGTLPMNVKNVEEFEVIESGKMLTTTDKDFFIKRNKEYSYLKDYPGSAVIYSFGGKARTRTEYFEVYEKK